MNDLKPGAGRTQKLTQTQKNNYVMQSAGARQACLELLHRVKDTAARIEIIRQGNLAEDTMLEYGGMFMGDSFEQKAHRIIMESTNA